MFFFIILFLHFVLLLLELERSLILGANKDIGRKDTLTSSNFFFFCNDTYKRGDHKT